MAAQRCHASPEAEDTGWLGRPPAAANPNPKPEPKPDPNPNPNPNPDPNRHQVLVDLAERMEDEMHATAAR